MPSRLPPEVLAWMTEEGIPVSPREIEAWLSLAGVGIKATYRVTEAAQILGFSTRAIYDLLARGDICAWRPAASPASARERDRAAGPIRIPLPALIRWYPAPAPPLD